MIAGDSNDKSYLTIADFGEIWPLKVSQVLMFIYSQAYKEGKKERPPFQQEPEPVAEKPEIPEDLLCNVCKDLLTDAVMIPCCGNSFCDECKLLELEYLTAQCSVISAEDAYFRFKSLGILLCYLIG